MAPKILLLFIVVALKDALPGECRFVPLDAIKSDEISVSTASVNSSRSLNPTAQELAVMLSAGVAHRGVKAKIFADKPTLGNPWKESSRQMLQITSGGDKIEVGWQVNPSMYRGDANPHQYVYTEYMEVQKDGTKISKSCWYDACGFTATNLAPVEETWTREKETEFHLFMNEQGNWQLKVDGEDVGFWPSDLFSGLTRGARLVSWGGRLTTTANALSRSSQIGNGVYPTRNNPWDSSLMMMEVQERDDSYVAPRAQTLETTRECYTIMDGGSSFFYGGPNVKCLP